MTSSLDKAVLDLARCGASGKEVWVGFSIVGVRFTGIGYVAEVTGEALAFQTSGVRMSLSWDWFQIKEVEFFTASDPETPDGFYPRGGWWRITTDTDALLHIGEMGDPPLVN